MTDIVNKNTQKIFVMGITLKCISFFYNTSKQNYIIKALKGEASLYFTFWVIWYRNISFGHALAWRWMRPAFVYVTLVCLCKSSTQVPSITILKKEIKKGEKIKKMSDVFSHLFLFLRSNNTKPISIKG